jgi:hypothetical protein
MRWNSALGAKDRSRNDELFLPRLMNVKSTSEIEQYRAWMAIDWLVREHAPEWLDLANLRDQATVLRSLPEVTCKTNFEAIRDTIEAAESASDKATKKLSAELDANKTWGTSLTNEWAFARNANRAIHLVYGIVDTNMSWDDTWNILWTATMTYENGKLKPTKRFHASASRCLDRMILKK